MGLRGKDQIEQFIQAVRDGEQRIEDADEAQGRDKSLAASLDYGFRNAFQGDELPIIALLHLFQGTVSVGTLGLMGAIRNQAMPQMQEKSPEQLTAILDRARDIGLLTQVGPFRYSIHPALPWFLRQLFASNYDGQDGRVSAETPVRSWVEAVAVLSECCQREFEDGKLDVIQLLALDEANLLHAIRIARAHEWWSPVINAVQGLFQLYDYQGRAAEWARLLIEIVPDFCTEDHEPVLGREEGFGLVMGYRVRVARLHEHDLTRAAALEEKLIAWIRPLAEASLIRLDDASLDHVQRNRIRELAVSVFTLGEILREQGSADCVRQYGEAISYFRLIKDTAGEKVCHFNLGQAYARLSDILDLDAAEAEYQLTLALSNANDRLGRGRCFQQIGVVHHERFNEARLQEEPQETVIHHARAAEEHYQRALKLFPASAVGDLGLLYNALGVLYDYLGQSERARECFEKSVQICQQTGRSREAGQGRFNMALMFGRAAMRAITPDQQRKALLLAQAYAQAALNDFKHYAGRCADEKAKAQQFVEDIRKMLARLSE